MKKLMIAAAIACATAMSYGAAASWTMAGKGIYDGTGETATANKYSGSAYFFDSGKIGQEALFTYLSAGNDVTKATGYVGTGLVETGVINTKTAANTITYGNQGTAGTVEWYFVLVESDQIYFSNIKEAQYPGGATATAVAFGTQSESSLLPGSSVEEGNWVAVPEPTSGLLLLLGVAGLALKRKRA